MFWLIQLVKSTCTQRARDAIITSSLRQHDVADVVLTWWRRYLCVIIALCVRWGVWSPAMKSENENYIPWNPYCVYTVLLLFAVLWPRVVYHQYSSGLLHRWYCRPISQIPQCISVISHNAPFCNRNVHTCGHFCYKMEHCGKWDWCVCTFLLQNGGLWDMGLPVHCGICVTGLSGCCVVAPILSESLLIYVPIARHYHNYNT